MTARAIEGHGGLIRYVCTRNARTGKQHESVKCLLVSYRPLGPKNNETQAASCTHDAASTLPALGKSHRSYAIDALLQRRAREKALPEPTAQPSQKQNLSERHTH